MRVAHAPVMPGTFSPPPRVSDPDMHHGTCATRVPWCMPGSLTSGILLSRWQGKHSLHSRRMRNPQFYASGKRPIRHLNIDSSPNLAKYWSCRMCVWHSSTSLLFYRRWGLKRLFFEMAVINSGVDKVVIQCNNGNMLTATGTVKDWPYWHNLLTIDILFLNEVKCIWHSSYLGNEQGLYMVNRYRHWYMHVLHLWKRTCRVMSIYTGVVHLHTRVQL